MNSIPYTSAARALPPESGAMAESQAAAAYIRKQSSSYTEQLNTGLTIKTKEGDLVTLNTSSFLKMEARQYDSRGVLRTGNKTVTGDVHHRQVTLATGEQFSFSVVGDLNDDELADIEKIILGIDDVITEMSQGDMAGAVEKALEMDGYDTVSMFTADIRLNRSFQAETTVAQTADSNHNLSRNRPYPGFIEGYMKQISEYSPQEKPGDRQVSRLEDLIRQMTEQIDRHPEKLVGRSRNAVEKLFNHQLKKYTVPGGGASQDGRGLETAADQVIRHMDRIAQQMFKDQFA